MSGVLTFPGLNFPGLNFSGFGALWRAKGRAVDPLPSGRGPSGRFLPCLAARRCSPAGGLFAGRA